MITTDKNYKYRNGEPARILCTDANQKQPVISLTPGGDALHHNSDGTYRTDSESSYFDLIEVREPRRVWLNFYGPMAGSFHSSQERARDMATPEVTQLAVEFEEVLK